MLHCINLHADTDIGGMFRQHVQFVQMKPFILLNLSDCPRKACVLLFCVKAIKNISIDSIIG